MSSERKYTPSQQNVISFRGQSMLVSASAGTGKTTVMIERIMSLLAEGADVSEIVVVTFTNLAAAEMKNRLSAKLAERKGDNRLIEQLERLDTANISTLHSFCGNLLRNYFYVADIDPSFTILDNNLVKTLQKNAMDEVFLQYFNQNDKTFKKVYKIFSKSRQESNFRNVLLELYGFSRCIENFGEWYASKRGNLTEYGDNNPLIATVMRDIRENVAGCAENMRILYGRSANEGLSFAQVFKANAETLEKVRLDGLEHALFDLYKLNFIRIPARSKKADYGVDKEIEEQIRRDYADVTKEYDEFAKKYVSVCRGEPMDKLWKETQSTVELLDKLVEIITRFDETYFKMKKERGGLDFNDLEHLTVRILDDAETLADIRSRYKMIFVDEYQDTNPVQEAIISRLASAGSLFMVGDVKQSIYGFRGCEPSIFVDKYKRFKTFGEGHVEELNDNFRSNCEILNFVNKVFDFVMTESFGKVDYRRDAQLRGSAKPTLKTASCRMDLLLAHTREKNEITQVYDITEETRTDDGVKQGELIARRIKEYVGTAYRDSNGIVRRINYGDVVILMRSLTYKATEIYNALVSRNIPVVANFKTDGYSAREIKDLINLLRVIDNPYNDIYIVGVCLSSIGGFTESELGVIRLDTAGRVPFYDRLTEYAASGGDGVIVGKINAMLDIIEQLRFYARSATVSEVVLRALQLTQYQLFVQGLPNAGLRIRKLYAFIDGVKDAAYAQSVDRFLSYIDESEDNRAEEGAARTNAVRIMTMHASKGLEFPVVILAGLETKFRFDNPEVERNFDLGLSLKYYDFDSMKYAPTLSVTACGLFNKTKSREEEMRLLYVAMTRAKYALYMVGTVTDRQLTSLPKAPVKAMSHLDWVLGAVKTEYKSFTSDFAADKLEINVIESLADDATDSTSVDNMCPQDTDEQAICKRLTYRYPYAEQQDMPTKVVSSALDKEYVYGEDDEQAITAICDDADRNFVGTAYHKVYQYVNYNADKRQIADTVEGLVLGGVIERRFADKLDIDLVYRTLNNPELKRLLSVGTIYHELPFMLYVPYDKVSKDKRYTDNVMLQGVIDLLVIDGNKATVIDFKYTSHSDRVQANYSAQLNSYRLAVEQICGITDVRCYVLSIADNKLINM